MLLHLLCLTRALVQCALKTSSRLAASIKLMPQVSNCSGAAWARRSRTADESEPKRRSSCFCSKVLSPTWRPSWRPCEENRGQATVSRLNDLSVVLEDIFKRGRVEDVFGTLFELFERGSLQPAQGCCARWAEAASKKPFKKSGFAFESAFELALLQPLLQSLLQPVSLPLLGPFVYAFGQHGVDLL